MSNYFLAAYSSPYKVISNGLTKIMIEAAQLYKDIIDGRIDSPFANMPRMLILYFLQLLMRNSYSFNFFKTAMENAALEIASGAFNNDIKVYALYFLNVAYIDLKIDESFDFLLKDYSDNLPIDLDVAIYNESKHLKEKNKLIKNQCKYLKKILKRNPSLNSVINNMYEKPVKSLLKKEKSQKKITL